MKKIIFISLFGLIYCDNLSKCGTDSNCAERELVSYIDKMDHIDSMPVVGDYLILKRVERSTRNSKSSELFSRGLNYLRDHELVLRIPASEGRSSFLESRKHKIKKILMPILLLLKLKAIIILPAILSVIALVAFKGLGVGLVALAVAGASSLKNILDSHHNSAPKVTYEVVPQLASSHWSRTGLDSVNGGVSALQTATSAADLGLPTRLSPLAAGYHTIP